MATGGRHHAKVIGMAFCLIGNPISFVFWGTLPLVYSVRHDG